MAILPSEAMEEIEEIEENTDELPLLVEFGVDFKTGQLTGNLVYGIEAVKVWMWNLFHTPRYIFNSLTWDYGHELLDLIQDEDSDDEEYLQSVGEDAVEDAVSINEYITGVNSEITKDKDILHLELSVDTVYGELEVSYDV